MSTQQKEFDCFFFLSVLFFHMSVTIVRSCVMSHAGARCRPETKAYSSNCYKPSSTHTRPTRQIIAPHHGRNYIIGLLHSTENCFFISYQSIYLSICLYLIHPSISLSLSVCLSVYLSVCLYHVRGISYDTSTSALSWKNCRVSSTR